MRRRLLLIGALAGVATLTALLVDSHIVKASSRWPAVAASCGGEHRWAVKTLSDSDADKVRDEKPKRHTVKYMLGRTDPHVGVKTARDADGSHVEVTLHQLVGVRLVNARIEEDGDIHLVIRDKYREHMMIVELPNTVCKGAKSSSRKAEMKQARDEFAALCGLPSWATRTKKASPKALSGSSALIGVGFFDLKHGSPQVGVAANNIELHPLLQFSAENCHLEPH